MNNKNQVLEKCIFSYHEQHEPIECHWFRINPKRIIHTMVILIRVIVETLDLQVCQAPRVPLERLAQWVPQEMQDKEEIR